jgi:hypothetical protein
MTRIKAVLKSAAWVTLAVGSALSCAPLAMASDHPGNVFVVGDPVRVAVPNTWAVWRAVDIDGKQVGIGNAQAGMAVLGNLPVGYYEIREPNGGPRITVGVLAKTSTSDDTPIAIDAAMSWFYAEPDKIRNACTLCRLAGVKWVRDRLSWPEMEPAKGKLAEETRYERAMRIQHEAGLKILQVNHASPPWASNNGSHFPEDLRDAYNFYRALAKRWHGLADAVEPWNEPDIVEFGGHTGCEIASFQKASYLGFKAGDPKLPVCESVFAIDRPETLNEFGANEVYPYFDLYNLHHYIALPNYPRAYARHRAVSGGRPLWTTEFNLTINWADEKTKEPTDDDLRIQGYRVSKVFAKALHEGTVKAFYFILGHYVERKLQYGLVHEDLTPRPAYIAFAAVGRLLNAAEPLGRVDLGDEKLMGYLFKTVVNGEESETLVAWSETNPTKIDVAAARTMFDYLGREMPHAEKVELTRAPIFALFARGASKQFKIAPPPAKAKWLNGEACPVVLQLLGKGDAAQSAFVLDDTKELRLVAYNFGAKPVRGTLAIVGAKANTDQVEIAPGARVEQILKVADVGDVLVRLDLGNDGHPLVSSRVTLVPTAKPGK